MSQFTQQKRCWKITTPLGPDTLLLQSFECEEGLSQLFSASVTCFSENRGLQPAQLLGQNVSVEVQIPDGPRRVFHGLVRRFAQAGDHLRLRTYHLELAPWLWLLTQTSRCRVFQDKTVPEIVKKVFSDGGFTDFKDELTGTYTKLDYCVQYRESDFNFVTRLLEQEGIFYFFKHESSKHTLVLADGASSHANAPGAAKVPFVPEKGIGTKEQVVVDFQLSQELGPGKYAYRDYQFQMPDKSLDASEPAKTSHAATSKLEVYDYPGEYAQRFNKPDERMGDVESEGKKLVKMRMEQGEAAQFAGSGVSTCASFGAGFKFQLDATDSVFVSPGAYVLKTVHHSGVQSPSYFSDEESQTVYHNTFTCLYQKSAFRPPLTTPKPVVQGLQPALVTGPSGSEIHTDKYGRIRVQFPWDREGKKDENSACWLRVGQAWAGKQWGSFYWPRVGHEVLVAFLEGDPDQPLVVGSLYNAENLPPYEMPGKQTQSGVKSRSTPKGGAANFNEFRFEDKKGEELVYLHAEKDFERVVENNDKLKVGFDKKDDGDQSIQVFNNQTVEIGTPQAKEGSQTVTIWKDRSATLKTGNDQLQIEKGNRSAVISLGNDELRIKIGNQTTKLDVGKSSTEALQSIELKVGQSSIVVDQTGVTIKGLKVKIEGQVMTEVKGLMTQIKGDAMLVAKGAIAMIN